MADDVTVTLAKNAKRPARVRNGNRVYQVDPGGEAQVPARIAAHLTRQGCRVKSQKNETEAPEGAGS